MRMVALKEGYLDEYYSEGTRLSPRGLEEILNEGHAWDLSETLRTGGSALFPHTFIGECGHQIAAVVQGCLESGADQVLALGIYHTRGIEEIKAARLREHYREDITDEPYWGIFPKVAGEYSLTHFKTLWNAEVRRRGIKPPKLIERYPCLVNRAPHKLLGIEELERIAKDSVIVVTGDLCHHGVAYETDLDRMFPIGSEGVEYARESIEEGFQILEEGDYHAYYDHCWEHRNDAKDVLSVLHYLKGPFSANILDLKLVNTASLFKNDPMPSWVASSLVSLT